MPSEFSVSSAGHDREPTVEELKQELTEARRREVATAEILRVISRSRTDVQPVFDGILKSAIELCAAHLGLLNLYDGEKLRTVAQRGGNPGFAKWVFDRGPFQPDGEVMLRALAEGRPFQTPDMTQSTGGPNTNKFTELGGVRTFFCVPLLSDGKAIGNIGIYRREVRPFSEQQINLVSTFAEQAVIAIENTRLFEEVQARTRELTESLEYQTATAKVLSVISRSPKDLQPVLDTIVDIAHDLCEADYTLFRKLGSDGSYRLAASKNADPEFLDWLQAHPMVAADGSTVGLVAAKKCTIHQPDALADPRFTDFEGQQQSRARTRLGVPLLHAGEVIGVIFLARYAIQPFSERQIELVTTFADQAVIAIENARLFEEVQARTSELAKTVEDLEIASQHKSQFVANMSHELRTPLAAILGYAELMQEGFYEPQGRKSLDALTRIRSNGKHLLGLINTVLDIAKIESGQFTLNMVEYTIESVVETVRSATESLAQNKKLLLTTEVTKPLPLGLGDEQRLTQVLLNLVGNAIKFTDTGEVRVTAKSVNGHFAVSVTDTGPGIPDEHQARIFEQFHQVDSSNTKAKGGTGLGLAIAKQIVEMHGGRIWVESAVGKGSTFQMEIPARAEAARSG
jgi:signal transduction histidine kinase